MSQSSLVSTPGNLAETGSRRSTRIEKSVPLIVLGQNQMGEPFMERTVSVTVNMHGCRYASRHTYGVGTPVTLQMVGLNGSEEEPATVKAIVRSVHPPGSLRELQQVGVELETPANVWGIAPPPADWLSASETKTSTARLAAAIAPTKEVATKKAGEIPMKPESKVSEISGLPSPSMSDSQPVVSKGPQPPQAPRAVVTPEKLIAALQGKLQQEAEKAVQAAAAKQVNDAIQKALDSIEDARRSSVRQMQELIPKQLEAMKLSLKTESAKELAAQWGADLQKYRGRAEETAQRLEKQADELQRELANAQEYVDKLTREIAPAIPVKLQETVTRLTSEFESATAVIAEGHYEALVENLQSATDGALSKLDARLAEAQAIVQTAANSGLEELKRETELHVNMALAETKVRVDSALSSLDEDSRTTCDAHRKALEEQLARSAAQAAEQFHKRINAFLTTCMDAADGVVHDRSTATLDGHRTGDGKTL